jgi:hypothetical protein
VLAHCSIDASLQNIVIFIYFPVDILKLMVDGRDSFIEEGVFEGGFFIFLPESHSQLSKNGLFILGDGSDVRMKSKYR